MQIAINTDKLPPEITEAQVYDAIENSLMVFITKFGGVTGHEETGRIAAHVWKSLVKPAPQSEEADADALTEADRSYLKLVSKERNGHNDYMKGWRATYTIRKKLKRLKLVTITSSRACGMGDVDSTSCEITKAGRAVLLKPNL